MARFTREQIDRGIRKLRKRVEDVERLKSDSVAWDDARKGVVESAIVNTIRDVFGPDSPEYEEHEYDTIWYGGHNMGDTPDVLQAKFEAGIPQAVHLLQGLIARLEEELEDAEHEDAPRTPSQQRSPSPPTHQVAAPDVLLEPEQRELLLELVETARSIPRADRAPFWLAFTKDPQDHVKHPALPDWQLDAHRADVEILERRDLIHVLGRDKAWITFAITPEGHEFYRRAKLAEGQPDERVESELRRLVDATRFRQRYAVAHGKWADAEAKLWGGDSQRELTTIGHLCREAMIAFADELALAVGAPVASEKSKTVDRVRAAINARRGGLGAATSEVLDALLAYWGTVSDLVQRQEHGAEREGEPLAWEDGRRVVFYTLLVMIEVDRALRA